MDTTSKKIRYIRLDRNNIVNFYVKNVMDYHNTGILMRKYNMKDMTDQTIIRIEDLISNKAIDSYVSMIQEGFSVYFTLEL